MKRVSARKKTGFFFVNSEPAKTGINGLVLETKKTSPERTQGRNNMNNSYGPNNERMELFSPTLILSYVLRFVKGFFSLFFAGELRPRRAL